MNKKQKKAKLTLDIIACALSAVSTGLSIAAFVISLVRRNEKYMSNRDEKTLDIRCRIWYSIKAVSERQAQNRKA